MSHEIAIRRAGDTSLDAETWYAPAGTPIPPGFELYQAGPVGASTPPSGLESTIQSLLSQVGLGFTMPEHFGEAPVDYLSALSSFTAPVPGPPTADTLAAGRTVARHGLPMAASMAGSAAGGPIGSTIGGLAGEALGQWAAGDPFDPMQIFYSGALSGVPAVAGRAANSGYRAAERLAKGPQMYKEALADQAPIALPTLKAQVDDFIRQGTTVSPSPLREPTAGYQKLRNQLSQINDYFSSGIDQSLETVNQLRKRVGQFIQEAGTMDEGRALYAALMTDLREAFAGGNKMAGQYLRAIANDAIERAMLPAGWAERMMSWGLSGAALSGHPGAALPAIGALGYRTLTRTPWSIAEPTAVGLGQTAGRETLWPTPLSEDIIPPMMP